MYFSADVADVKEGPVHNVVRCGRAKLQHGN